MDTYLREFAQSLRLDPDETRAIVAEVRGNLEDLVAHLRVQGYGAEEAEEEAIRRFDDAGGLARALRRAHRRAPLPLRAVALLVGAAGLAALALTLEVIQTALAASAHQARLLILALPTPGQPRFVPSLEVLLINVLPIVAPGLIGVASLWLAVVVLRGHRRRRWRRIGAGAATLATLDGGLLLLVAATIPHGAASTDALPALVPNAQALVAASLTGRPAPGQPGQPVAVDRVLVDTTATYVQYHIPDMPHEGRPTVALFDDAGHSYQGGSGSSGYRPIDQLLPWRPPEQHLDQFAPLRPEAHAAVLRFSLDGRVVETVRVPLALGALRLAGRTRHPGVTTSARGFRATLVEVTRGVAVSHLTYTFDPRPGLVRVGQGVSSEEVAVTDTHGQRLDQQVIGTWTTACVPWTRPRSCTWTTTGLPFASAPSGAHLTLTMTTLDINGPRGQDRLVHGVWRLPFVMP